TPSAELLAAIAHASEDARLLALRDAQNLTRLRAGDAGDKDSLVLQVPAFDGDVHDVRALARWARCS
ncbi:MAG: hypothetical protein IPJ34_35980, partial [Myxococcales bacterium]|nr:hypothetical protein [Myxococcales bacterium]